MADFYPLCGCDGTCGLRECKYVVEDCSKDFFACEANEVSKRCCDGECINPNNFVFCAYPIPSKYKCESNADCEGIWPYPDCVKGYCTDLNRINEITISPFWST